VGLHGNAETERALVGNEKPPRRQATIHGRGTRRATNNALNSGHGSRIRIWVGIRRRIYSPSLLAFVALARVSRDRNCLVNALVALADDGCSWSYCGPTADRPSSSADARRDLGTAEAAPMRRQPRRGVQATRNASGSPMLTRAESNSCIFANTPISKPSVTYAAVSSSNVIGKNEVSGGRPRACSCNSHRSSSHRGGRHWPDGGSACGGCRRQPGECNCDVCGSPLLPQSNPKWHVFAPRC
jgi:hypothetical protein